MSPFSILIVFMQRYLFSHHIFAILARLVLYKHFLDWQCCSGPSFFWSHIVPFHGTRDHDAQGTPESPKHVSVHVLVSSCRELPNMINSDPFQTPFHTGFEALPPLLLMPIPRNQGIIGYAGASRSLAADIREALIDIRGDAVIQNQLCNVQEGLVQ